MVPVGNFNIQDLDVQLTAKVVPWDTTLLGFPVGQIESLKTVGAKVVDLTAMKAWIQENSIQLVSCRLPHDALNESATLERNGFRFIEMVYPMVFPKLRDTVFEPSVELNDAEIRDIPEIQRIAKAAFTTGRFNIDPMLGNDLGGARYAGWVQNSFNDQRHKILVARLDGKIVGFFIVEGLNQNELYWHLTAIAPEWQGKGLGERVWKTIMMRNKADGFSTVKTMIAARNFPVLNLYGKLGFRFAAPQMTFHWVNEELTKG